jgi:hypothetical protein
MCIYCTYDLDISIDMERYIDIRGCCNNIELFCPFKKILITPIPNYFQS